MMEWITNTFNCTNNNNDDSIFTLIQNKIEETINADQYYADSEKRKKLLEQNIDTIKQCINN